MPEFWEQKATFPAPSPTIQRRQERAYRQPVRTDDVDDDALYETRSPNSTRRYAPAAPPRTVMCVTHHNVPPRASLRPIPPQDEQPTPAQQQPTHRRSSWVFFVGVGMVLAVLLVIGANLAIAGWNDLQDTLHYGYPRTYQCDANVGHGGMSHFIVENLHGHVFVFELLVNDPGHTKIYVGPVLTGPGADREPVTVSFHDENGEKLPAMLLQVGQTQYLYPNTGQGFRVTTQPSKIGA